MYELIHMKHFLLGDLPRPDKVLVICKYNYEIKIIYV